MSYCRFSPTSDVYVFKNVKGIAIHTSGIEDAANQRQEFLVAGPMQAITVLQKLQRGGYQVPKAAIDRLLKEARP